MYNYTSCIRLSGVRVRGITHYRSSLEAFWLSIYILRPAVGYLVICDPETPETRISFHPSGYSFIRTESLSSVVLLVIVCQGIAVHLYSDIHMTFLGVTDGLYASKR